MSHITNWANTWWPPIGDRMPEKLSITDFLLARITEDEEGAKEAIDSSGWGSSPDGHWEIIEVPYEGEWPRNPDADDVAWSQSAWALHASRHDPQRVLRECAAKRAIVEAHRVGSDPYGDPDGVTCTVCTDSGPDAQGFPCATIRAIAAVYSDHPDFQSEWSRS